MVDQEVFESQVKVDRFPFPSEGEITLAVRNANYTLGPVMLHIGMKPGAVIPAHLHKGMAEALYVMEGDFTNEGKQYPAGTSLHFKAGKAHGPHTTTNGCNLLVLWTEASSNPTSPIRPRLTVEKRLLRSESSYKSERIFPETAAVPTYPVAGRVVF